MNPVLIRLSSSLLLYYSGGREKVSVEGRCRMCRLGPPRVLTRHHLVPQSWFKNRLFVQSRSGGGGRLVDRHLIRDCDANVVPLCIQCHRAVEHDEQARRMLRKVLGANEMAFMVQLVGEEWVDERYPSMLPRSAQRVPRHERVPIGWEKVI